MKQQVVLAVDDLSVAFQVRGQQLKAIRHVSLELYDQEILAVVGESGSGKSVLTKTFTGMLEENGRITGGQIQYGDTYLSDLKTDREWDHIRGKGITTIFQDPMTSLDPIKTIGSQIAEVIIKHQHKSSAEAKAQAIELMTRTGIPAAAERYNAYPFEYSGGMRQRIVIAVALACHPRVLICDEPTTALDVTIQAQILDLIKQLQREYHFSIIFITHDLGVVAAIADRIAVMYAGQIVELGTCDEIFYDPRHPYTWSLLSALPQLATADSGLYSIPGTPPSLFHDIKGDAFAPRNRYALAADFKQEPPKFAVSPTHWAKTWLLDPRAPQVEKPALIQNLHARLVTLTKSEMQLSQMPGGTTSD